MDQLSRIETLQLSSHLDFNCHVHFIKENLTQKIKMKRNGNTQKCQFIGQKSRKSFTKFAEHVGPHGLTYIIRFVFLTKMITWIFSKELPFYRRAFWSLIFIIGLTYSFYMCFRNGTRYFNHPSIIKPTTVKYFFIFDENEIGFKYTHGISLPSE